MTQRKRTPLIFAYCLLIAACCLAICSKSSFLYPLNDWTDANAYFSCGKGMLAGRVMYRDLYEHKGPLLYALHALCCLIDGSSFIGVFLLESLAVGTFLFYCHKLLTLHGARRSALPLLPILAALVLSSVSFQQGDSAEELCLPLLAYAMYSLLLWLRTEAPARMRTRTLIVNGILCGCVLWIKFTMLGLYGVWILWLFVHHATRKEWKHAFACVGWFALGLLIATVPWLLYFGLNGAMVDWLKTYLYDNIFLYTGSDAVGLFGKGKAIVKSALSWLTTNWAYTLPLVAGLIVLTIRRTASAAEKWLLWLMLGVSALGVFIGGKTYPYYGLILAAFVWLVGAWLCPLLDPLLEKRGAALSTMLTVALGVGSVGLCLAASENTPDLLKPREDTMQYRFAAIVNETPDATLLNYGFMDAGFYTACSIVPSVKYFHQTNVPLQDMYDEQIRYIAEGLTDYVVTRGRQPDCINDLYELVATEDSPDGFWYEHVYLYRLKTLG